MTAANLQGLDPAPDAVILAGGKGTRLRPVVSDRPKPMAPVHGKPFLELLIERLRAHGLKRFILSVGHMSGQIREHFGDGAKWDARIDCVNESSPLGTGGAVYNSLGAVETDPFFVFNGDSFCDANLTAMLRRHQETNASATLHAVEVPDCSRYGTVSLDSNGSVTDFGEKTGDARPGLINSGIYLLNQQIFANSVAGKVFSLERDIFPSLTDGRLRAAVGAGPFLDIGLPESYAAAPEFFAALARNDDP